MNHTRPNLRFVIMAWVAASGAFVSAQDKPKPVPQKLTAEQLIADAERALFTIAKAAKDSDMLDPKNVRQQPFWTALKHTSETLKSMQTQLRSRDPKFFDTLNDGTRQAAELRSLYPRSGIKDPKVEEGVKAAANVLTQLRRKYGREAIRTKKGGELSEDEKGDFAKLKKAQNSLVEDLAELELQAHDNKHLSAELLRMITQLQASIDAPQSVETLQSARELVDTIEGEWLAYAYFVEPKYRQAWKDSKAEETLDMAEDIVSDFDGDPTDADWMHLDELVEVAAKAEPAKTEAAKAAPVDEASDFEKFLASLTPIELEAYYEEVLADDIEEDAYDELMLDDQAIQQPVPPEQ